MKPIEDPSENSLMLSSLAVTYVNIVIGAVSRIPEEVALDTLYPNLEKVLFDILVIGANVLVILILLVQYAMFIYRFFKEWRKNPRWSFSCCLALLLPLNDLQQEVLGMAGENVLKQQLKTGNVDMPSLSGALKESGAVSIKLTILPDHPEETNGSTSEETKTGRKKEGNNDKGTVSTGDKKEKVAEKVAFDKGEEPEKKRLPQDNLQQEIRQMRSKNPLAQQLQTDNVNNPSESGGFKKKGAVDFVLVTIHEQPKEACGSPSEERCTGVKKQGADNKVATNTPEEELEETRL
ncbi:PREDICTED: uncharacterized protein LOC107342147 [Acropora digitifera]|uniref:uncharacterized protein LOC107342147 n=1 Tax=Acropora digitifera TaxID=70779 RepID=UPI00077A69D6|nr:PREDICTED: uncharacterized protein LOC107342147 [Acropora digitifera]